MSSDRDPAGRRRCTGVVALAELAALVIAIVAGCSGSDVAPPPPAPPVTPVVRVVRAAGASSPIHQTPSVIVLDDPEIDLPKQESFALLGRGHGKPTVLRYAPATGSYMFLATAKLSSRQLTGASGTFSQPSAWPAIRDGFVVTPIRGELTLQAVRGEAAAVDPDAEAYLATWRGLLQDRRASLALDDRGMFTAVHFEAPGGSDGSGDGDARQQQAKDELIQRLLSTIIPLPAEPVGPGASWRVTTILRQGPAYAKQTATYTVQSIAPTSWKLHVKLQRVAEPQRMADASLPAGTSAELIAMFRLLEGDVEIDPARPLIRAGSMSIESRLHVKLQPPGEPASEHMFEDTGSVAFAMCPATGAAATAAGTPATGSATPAANSAARGAAALPACPAALAPTP